MTMTPEQDEPDPHTADHGGHAAPSRPALSDNGGPDETGASNTPPDATLGGYLSTHNRPPAFEGIDGQPYTVSIEVERTGDLPTPYIAYLVFPRWAYTGVGIVGHVESEIVARARTREQARQAAEALTLLDTKRLLDQAIQRKMRGAAEPEAKKHPPATGEGEPGAGKNL